MSAMYALLLFATLLARVHVWEDPDDRMMRELRIEMVKFQILSRLNLKAPPNTTSSRFSSQAVALLLRDAQEPQDPHEPAGRERLIVPAQGDGVSCNQTNITDCWMFFYEWRAPLDPSALFLWVYKKEDAPGELSVSLTTGDEEESWHFQVARKGWTKRRLMSNLLLPSNDTVQCALQIIGRDIEYQGPYRPYLMTSLLVPSSSRRRREVAECDTSQNCCLKPLRLSFAEIGFHFIVYPEALEANMCVGVCRHDHTTFRSHYERALATTLEGNATLRDTLGECWTQCCKPRQLKEVRVIYRDMEDLHHDQFIPDLSVQSCSCS